MDALCRTSGALACRSGAKSFVFSPFVSGFDAVWRAGSVPFSSTNLDGSKGCGAILVKPTLDSLFLLSARLAVPLVGVAKLRNAPANFRGRDPDSLSLFHQSEKNLLMSLVFAIGEQARQASLEGFAADRPKAEQAASGPIYKLSTRIAFLLHADVMLVNIALQASGSARTWSAAHETALRGRDWCV